MGREGFFDEVLDHLVPHLREVVRKLVSAEGRPSQVSAAVGMLVSSPLLPSNLSRVGGQRS